MEIHFTKSLPPEQILRYSQKSQTLVRGPSSNDLDWGTIYHRRRYSLSRLEKDLLLDLNESFEKNNVVGVSVTELSVLNLNSDLKKYDPTSIMRVLSSPNLELQDKKKRVREHGPKPNYPSGWGKMMICPHFVEIPSGFIVIGNVTGFDLNGSSTILKNKGYSLSVK
jgi:hypothetical protein